MSLNQKEQKETFVQKLLLWLPAIIACLLWSTAFAGIKIGLQFMDPYFFAGIRFTLAGFFVFIFALIKFKFNFKVIIENIPPFSYILTISIIQTFGMYIFHYTAMDWVPGAVSAIVIGSSPLMAALISHLLVKNDSLSKRKIISILIGILGIVILSLGKQFKGSQGWLMGLGIFFLFCSITLSVLANVFIKTRNIKSPLIFNAFQLILGGGFLLLFSLAVEKNPIRISEPLPPQFFFVLIWLSLVSAIAFSIWTTLLKRPNIKVSELNLWKFLVPACGAALAWWLVPGESFDWVTFGGMGVVSAAIVIYFI